jgi:hypothetical protein
MLYSLSRKLRLEDFYSFSFYRYLFDRFLVVVGLQWARCGPWSSWYLLRCVDLLLENSSIDLRLIFINQDNPVGPVLDELDASPQPHSISTALHSATWSFDTGTTFPLDSNLNMQWITPFPSKLRIQRASDVEENSLRWLDLLLWFPDTSSFHHRRASGDISGGFYCWTIRRLCECAQCAAIPGISVHSSFLLFSFIFRAVGPILSFSPFIL